MRSVHAHMVFINNFLLIEYRVIYNMIDVIQKTNDIKEFFHGQKNKICI
jgi:septum formation inhibitor-activating ATPase MinD